MSFNFVGLPRELRDQIYELVLLQEDYIGPCVGQDRRQELPTELFHVNKAIHREASSLFYARNGFDFTMRTPEEAASFLGQIGRTNADHIRHIYLDFPEFLHLDPGNVALEDDSVGIFAEIQSGCTNLSTLTTSLPSTNAMELTLVALDNPEVISEALKLVNTQLRAISSLQEIIVEVYEDGPSDRIRREMERHGWTIAENEEEEDVDRSFSDCGYDYDRYDSGSGDDEDDYDIDNDSDFWRRAAD